LADDKNKCPKEDDELDVSFMPRDTSFDRHTNT